MADSDLLHAHVVGVRPIGRVTPPRSPARVKWRCVAHVDTARQLQLDMRRDQTQPIQVRHPTANSGLDAVLNNKFLHVDFFLEVPGSVQPVEEQTRYNHQVKGREVTHKQKDYVRLVPGQCESDNEYKGCCVGHVELSLVHLHVSHPVQYDILVGIEERWAVLGLFLAFALVFG